MLGVMNGWSIKRPSSLKSFKSPCPCTGSRYPEYLQSWSLSLAINFIILISLLEIVQKDNLWIPKVYCLHHLKEEKPNQGLEMTASEPLYGCLEQVWISPLQILLVLLGLVWLCLGAGSPVSQNGSCPPHQKEAKPCRQMRDGDSCLLLPFARSWSKFIFKLIPSHLHQWE